jgi:hypothetical protein
MLHIVEVGSFCGDLIAALSNMMTWLNSRGSQPVILQETAGAGDRIPPAVQYRGRGSGLRLCVRRPVNRLTSEWVSPSRRADTLGAY